MKRRANAPEDRSLETDGGDSTTDSWESTVEAGASEDRFRETAPGERSADEPVTKQPLDSGEVYCWSCGVPIKSAAELCPECGVRQQPPPTSNDAKSPGLAALASAVWTGAGQVYNGDIAKGVGLMALMFVSTISIVVVVGFVTTPLIWLYSVYDAYRTAERRNQQSPTPNHGL